MCQDGRLDTSNTKICPLVMILSTVVDYFFSSISGHPEVVALIKNDPITSETLIRSYTHPKHQNLSTSDDFVHTSGIIFLVPFLATREVVALHANDLIMSGTSIRSFRHLEHQNLSIISEDIGRARSVQQFRRRNGTEERRSRRHTVVLEDRIN